MIQDQLVDYVSSQMKLGVSRDAIKSALVSAGWVAGDVEDTLKKIEGSGTNAASMGAAQAISASIKPSMTSSPMTSSISSTSSVSASAKPSEPQMIRVSDLVSNTKSTTSGMNMGKTDVSKFAGKISGNSFEATSPIGSSMSTSSTSSPKGKGGLIMGVIGVIIILGVAGLAWYFYSGNAGLAAQVASLNAQSATVNTQLTSLQSQLDASSTGFAAQIATLTAANADVALNLSFYAAPLGGPTSTATIALPVTISGWLSGGGKAPYAITTPRGAKIFIVNSTDAKISAQLKPIIGDTVQLVGTYVPGSDEVTVNTVTDLSPAAPAVATSTANTATSTASSTSTQ